MTTSRRLSVGDAAPDLTLADGAGEPVPLSALWGGRALLLVFLRHYG